MTNKIVSRTGMGAVAVIAALGLGGCASLTNDPNVPIELKFSDGSSGTCTLTNKRQTQEVSIPSTASVRRSDDSLNFSCMTDDGRTATGDIPSSIGEKIIFSAVLIDFGVTDAITDYHREYPVSATIIVPPK